MINPKDKGWLLDMKLPLWNKYCLMLLLTYVLLHKRAFALISSHTESNVVVLPLQHYRKVDLPVSPGHCCPALVPLKQGINVQQLPGLWSSCMARGYGQEQEECQAGTECHLSEPRAERVLLLSAFLPEHIPWPAAWSLSDHIQAQPTGLGCASVSLPAAHCEQRSKVRGCFAFPAAIPHMAHSVLAWAVQLQS